MGKKVECDLDECSYHLPSGYCELQKPHTKKEPVEWPEDCNDYDFEPEPIR